MADATLLRNMLKEHGVDEATIVKWVDYYQQQALTSVLTDEESLTVSMAKELIDGLNKPN